MPNAFRSNSKLLINNDLEVRNYHGWLFPVNDYDIVQVNRSLEVSSGLGETRPRPRCDLDGHPLHRMFAGNFTFTSHRMHYTNVDLPHGSEVQNFENGTVMLEDSIIEVFTKNEGGDTIASRWKYIRSLMEEPSSVPLKKGLRVTDWWCIRNEGISCPYGAIFFRKANFKWNRNYTWKLRGTLMIFVPKFEAMIGISDAFFLAIDAGRNYIYIPYDLALDFGVCKKRPIDTDTTIYDPNRSLPPNLVINFQERLYGCLEVYQKHTIRLADFVLRNIFSREAWPVVFPFVHSSSEATVILENVIIEMDTSSNFQTSSLKKMIRKVKKRSRPDGLGQGDQRLAVWQEQDCERYLYQSRDCQVNNKCPSEAQCPSGAIFIEDAAFVIQDGDGNDDLGIGMRYHIRHSLIKVIPAELPPPVLGATKNRNETIPQKHVQDSSRRVHKSSNSASMQVLLVVFLGVVAIFCVFIILCGFLVYHRGLPALTSLQGSPEVPTVTSKATIKFEQVDPINLAAEAAAEALAVKELEVYQNYQQTANKLLGSVTLGPLLGAGSFGKVFKADWNGATVAVKVVVHDGLNYLGTSAQREASLSSDLHHPNIVQTFLQTTREIRSTELLAPVTPSNDEEGGLYFNQRSSSHVQSAIGPSNNHGGAGYFDLNDLDQDPLGLVGGVGALPDPFGEANTEDWTEEAEALSQNSADRKETWMIQEFCDMGSLEKAIRKGKFVRNNQLEMVLVVETCVDICRGMIYLNNRNIIHGDLKSSNILINGSFSEEKGFIAKVADFGLSRELGMHASHIKTRTTGTVTHMPPELFKEEKMTAASDVYSFGIVMWELVSKESPLEGVPHFLIIKKILYDNWRPTFAEGIPSCYIQLAQRCWAEDSSQRPLIQQVLNELELMRQLFLEEEIASSSVAT
eukprot:g6966.t1